MNEEQDVHEQKRRVLARREWARFFLVSSPFLIILLPSLIGLWDISFGTYEEWWTQFFFYYKNAIHSGENFLWNPYMFSGFPLFVSVNGGFLSPLFFGVLYFFSVPVAYHLLAFINLAISAWVVALIAKRIGMNYFGQWVAGVVYGFSAWYSIANTIELNVFPVLPVLVLMLLVLQERPRWWPYGVGFLIVFHGWVASHWSLFLLHLIGAGIVALYLGGMSWKNGWKNAIYPFFSLGIMVAGGTLLGLVQIIPTLTYIPLSVQFFLGAFTHSEAIRYGITPFKLIPPILPFLDFPLIPSLRPIYLGGVLQLFFIAIAFTLRRAFGWRSFFSWFLLITLLFSLDRSPFFWLLHHIPPITFIHGPDKFLWVSFFATSILAGYGAEIVLAQTHKRKMRIIELVTSFILLMIAVISAFATTLRYLWYDRLLFLLTSYFDEFLYMPSLRYSPDYYHRYLEGLLQKALSLFDIFEPRFLTPFLFLMFGYIIMRWIGKGLFCQKWRIYLVGTFMAFNFVAIFPLIGDHSMQEYFRDTPPTALFLTERIKPGERVFSFLASSSIFEKLIAPHGGAPHIDAEVYAFQTALISTGLNRFNISSTEYGEPLAWISMTKLISYIGSPVMNPLATTTLASAALPLDKKIQMFSDRRSILNLLGIRYITSVYALDEAVFPKVFETTATSYHIPVYIYENKKARPLYYFTNERWLLDLPETVSAERLQRLIDQGVQSHKITQRGIEQINQHNDRLTLNVHTDTESILVFSQNNLPGWRAFIDNKRVPLHDFATVYQSIQVPKGDHIIQFKYSYGEIWEKFTESFFTFL